MATCLFGAAAVSCQPSLRVQDYGALLAYLGEVSKK